MWAEASVNGPAQLRVAQVSVEGKASAVFEWMEASTPFPDLSPFVLMRGGGERHRLETELRVRAALYCGAVPLVRSTLCSLGALFIPHLPHLDTILQPRPAGQELGRLLHELNALARGGAAGAPSPNPGKDPELRAHCSQPQHQPPRYGYNKVFFWNIIFRYGI